MANDFNRELRRLFVLFLVRPAVVLCGVVITSTYKVLFAWWLDPLAQKGSWRRLKNELLKDYAWLFDEYGARVIPMKPHRQVMNYTSVTIAVEDLLFQFVRGMGEFRVNVAPAHAPHDWYDFGDAIILARGFEQAGNPSRYYRMTDFEQLFESNIEGLKFFFSKAQYGEARRDLFVTRLIPL